MLTSMQTSLISFHLVVSSHVLLLFVYFYFECAGALGIVSAVVFGNNYATFVFNVSGSDASLRWAFWTLIAVALVDFVASVLFALRSLNDCCCVEREYDSMSTREYIPLLFFRFFLISYSCLSISYYLTSIIHNEQQAFK